MTQVPNFLALITVLLIAGKVGGGDNSLKGAVLAPRVASEWLQNGVPAGEGNTVWRTSDPVAEMPATLPTAQNVRQNSDVWGTPYIPDLANNDGYLRKIPQPHTQDLGAWALFLDGKVDGPRMFTVTAYNHEDGYTPGTITASGIPVFEGVAACGPEIELGSVVVLENGMVLRCWDRGSRVGIGDIDIYLSNLEEAREWGVQQIRGVILTNSRSLRERR